MSKKDWEIQELKGKDVLASLIQKMDDGQKVPSYKVTSGLETVHRAVFVDTQARTHIITGSLKASGKSETDFDGETWTGKITYGGVLWKPAAPGPPNDPVDYAIYEMDRGGSHDFFGGIPSFAAQIDHIVDMGFPG